MNVRSFCRWQATAVLLMIMFPGCEPDEARVRSIVREEMTTLMERANLQPSLVIGPYSPAVRIGNLLFVSGQIGINRETGELMDESIETETRQVMENLRAVLQSAGFDSSHVVSATVYLTDMDDYARMNLIYGGYFPEDGYPARAAVEVSELPRGANVEISVIAYKP
jgi:2-iminobutanoate/2-iminopropanoate deaminase